MKPHCWEAEEIDGGPVGIQDFWKCVNCGASAGPVWPGQLAPKWNPFLGNGSGLQLTNDCDESRRLIEAFNLGLAFAEVLRK